jgi:hypothetical protein
MSEPPLAPDIVPALRYPAELAQEVLARYGQHLPVVPAGLTSSVVLDAGPPAHVVVHARHDGPVADVRAWFDEWRRWAEPGEDTVSLGHAADLDASADEPGASTVVTTTAWLRNLDDDVIAVLADGVLSRDPAVERVEVRHVATATRRGPGGERGASAGLLLQATTVAFTEAEGPRIEQRLADLHAALSAIGAISQGPRDGFTAGHHSVRDPLPPPTRFTAR